MASKHFIIAGAQRSGSTFLAQSLLNHPQIRMAQPLFPEPKYFLPSRINPSCVEYKTLFFPRSEPDCVFGEKSVSYFDVPGSAKRIHQFLPSAKLVFILRDPVLRAVSNYYFSVQHGFETRTLEEAFSCTEDQKPEGPAAALSASPFAYLSRGLYAKQLQPWMEVFGRERIYLLILENWAAEDYCLINLFRYLEVDPSALPGERKPHTMRDESARSVPDPIRERLTDFFYKENKRLSELFQLDLSRWTQHR